jgi:hypothetical protein
MKTLALLAPDAHLQRMFEAFEFYISTKATMAPDSPDWLHEVKYEAGPGCHRLKVKNPDSPAMKRAAEVDWSRPP